MKSELRTPKSEIRKVVGYARVSTKTQAREGNSLEAQEQQIKAYAQYKKAESLKIFVNDDKGESAVKVDFLERPEVADMLLYAKQNDVADIIITKLDRGFRNAVDLLLTIDILKAQGIRVHLLDIGLDPTTPQGEMIATIMAAIAKFECARRRERQLECFAVAKANGKLCGTVPYGWTITPSLQNSITPTLLVPDEEEQRVLCQIVHWIEIDKLAVTKIARFLNSAGTPTKKGGKKWFPATVASVYKHRRLSGSGIGGGIGVPPMVRDQDHAQDAHATTKAA